MVGGRRWWLWNSLEWDWLGGQLRAWRCVLCSLVRHCVPGPPASSTPPTTPLLCLNCPPPTARNRAPCPAAVAKHRRAMAAKRAGVEDLQTKRADVLEAARTEQVVLPVIVDGSQQAEDDEEEDEQEAAAGGAWRGS